MESKTINDIDKVSSINITNNILKQEMKQLISTLQKDENSNKYYYNKMLADFEMESRHEEILRKKKNKWRAESQKYIERVQSMKEKKAEMYLRKMNKLQKDLKKKDSEIKNRIEQNKKAKEAERKHSLDIIIKKEKSARETYNRKLKMEEEEREENERKLLEKCKKIIK